jgi:hypothetical protein
MVFPVPGAPFRSERGTPSGGSPGPVILIKVMFPAVFVPSKKIESPMFIPPDPRYEIVTVPLAAVTGSTMHIAATSRMIAIKQVLTHCVFIFQPHFKKNIIETG